MHMRQAVTSHGAAKSQSFHRAGPQCDTRDGTTSDDIAAGEAAMSV